MDEREAEALLTLAEQSAGELKGIDAELEREMSATPPPRRWSGH
jgi:hypothetical protein